MGSKTNAFETLLLQHLFESADMSLDATSIWIGLCSGTPSDSAFTELSYNLYARVALDRTAGVNNVFTVSNGSVTNDEAITFANFDDGGGSVTVTGFGIFEAASGGTQLYWGEVTPNLTLTTTGDPVEFAAGQMTITED